MKKKLCYIIFVCLFFFKIITSSALTYGGCEYSDISRLKSFVANINFSYDYYIENNRANFSITLNNIVPGIYFVDSSTGIKYDYYSTTDGEITIGGYTQTKGYYSFYSELSECYGIKLANRYYTFPSYNSYYEDSLCKENMNYSLCQKWTKVTYSYDEFQTLINKYNENKEVTDDLINDEKIVYKKTYFDMFVAIYVEYYYFILIGIIVICVALMIINRRKNRFDL